MKGIAKAVLVLISFALIGSVLVGHSNVSSASLNGIQDTVYLDRRISMLETRLSSIESSLRMLQQQASAPSYQTPTTRDPETQLLRSEVAVLSGRVRELECGLVHLDERTLTPVARQARKQASAQSTDPCRVKPRGSGSAFNAPVIERFGAYLCSKGFLVFRLTLIRLAISR